MTRSAGPVEAGLQAAPLQDLERGLERHVTAGSFPGGVVAIGRAGALGWLRAFGGLGEDPAAEAAEVDTLYDLASLTKVVVTTTLAMQLVEEGRLELEHPVAAFVPGFRGGARDAVTVRQLLSHSAGLDWWAPLYRELEGRAAYVERIAAMELVYAPGSRALYSDLGVILLGEVLRRASGEELESAALARVLGPLGMRDTGYRPGAALRARVAPTEWDPWRGRRLRGEVHDENAWAMGGVAPHAGLFGSARDLARFARMLLGGGGLEGRQLVGRETVELFTRRDARVPGSSRALGWDTPSETGGSSAGRFFSERAYGHTGFTGTSLWLDPERDLFAILLTNRVFYGREGDAILAARAEVCDAAVRAVLGREPEPRRPACRAADR